MSARRATVILAVGSTAALGLVGLVAYENQARARGAEVRMAMEAVDPRGLLTGHYAELELRDVLPGGALCPPMRRGARGRSWLVLRQLGGRHVPTAAHPTEAGARRDGLGVVVRGGLTCEAGAIRTDVGVDRFHADQAEAEAIEAALQNAPTGTPAYAVLSVGKDGRARLKAVIVEGRRVDLDWF